VANPTLIRVAPGPTPSLEDLAWEERAQALNFETLGNIRSSAEKWAAAISSLTGVFGIIALLKGPQDISVLPTIWKVLVIVLVALAVGLASFGILQALMAAQGAPQKVLPIGREIKRLYRADAKVAADRLGRSRAAVMLAVVSLGLAILATWLGTPTPAAGKVMVVEAAGGAPCGDLQAGDAGYVTILPSATDQPTRIPLSDVKAVRPVKSCP
jgi:hypothetical protein